MSETISGKLQVTVDLTHTKTKPGFTNPIKDPYGISHVVDFTSGDGSSAGQWNEQYCKQHIIAAGTNLTLDMAGTLVNGIGNTVSFNKCNLIAAQLKKGGSAAPRLNIYPAASNGFTAPFNGDATSTLTVRAGDSDGKDGILVNQAGDITGLDVVASTGDLLVIANPSSSDATLNLMIGGNQ